MGPDELFTHFEESILPCGIMAHQVRAESHETQLFAFIASAVLQLGEDVRNLKNDSLCCMSLAITVI